MERHTLSFADWRAELAPHIGGSILSVTRRGICVLRPTTDAAFTHGWVRKTACYPLIPSANRISQGRFAWDGIQHRLAVNFPDSAHPLHGVGWQSPWIVVSASPRHCELRLVHRSTGRDDSGWPFAFEASQAISLGERGLTVDLLLANTGDSPAPFGLGLHPLFPRRHGERLKFVSAGAWCNGPDMLPSREVSGGLWDHSAGQLVGAERLDNDFVGWNGTAEIISDEAPPIRISASPTLPYLRVFTPADQDFFAVEPVSHLTDAINRTASGVGMTRVEPGGRLKGSVVIDTDSP